jgi:hypothetical protein
MPNNALQRALVHRIAPELVSLPFLGKYYTGFYANLVK